MPSKRFRILHYPQVPCVPFEVVGIKSKKEAFKIRDMLANYDLFLLENNHRVDFCNAIVVEVWDGKEWISIEEDDDDQ